MRRAERAQLHRALRKARLELARTKGTHTDAEWTALVAEMGGRCAACGIRGRIEKDHIVLIARGGGDAIDNLQPFCPGCNAGKGLDATNWVSFRREHGFND